MIMKSQYMKSALITAVVSLAFATPALAVTDTTTFQVTTTVNDSCTVTAADMAFGAYDAGAGVLNTTSTITATCTAGTSYDIGLDVGSNNANVTSTTRAMDDGASSYLDYELYLDSDRTTVLGTTVATDTRSNASATAGANTETVYGQIPGGQYVPAASYSDTINVTITY